jgi:glycosyltransferase involved in cell wall biosynthesis
VRIALDATPLSMPTGGIRRYTVELAAALADREPRDEIFLVADQSIELPERLRCLANVSAPQCSTPLLRAKWWSVGLPLTLIRLGADVFHGTDFSVPYVPITPSVMTIHDLSPWKTAALRPAGSARIANRTPYLLPLATRIHTPTEAIRREAISYFGLAKSRVRSIHHGVAPLQPDPSCKTPPEPYIAYLGDHGARKNTATLLAAWRLARGRLPDLGLVMLGPGGASIPNEPGLTIVGGSSDSELAAWLAGARALVYPSLYEGFGLPVIEAMSLGVPVITSHDPALVEVAGGCALHVPADSAELLSEAILRTAVDRELAKRLRIDGLTRATEFSWQRSARLTRELYLEAIHAW